MAEPLPPHVQAAVDELLACAPPLSPAQRDLIRWFGQPARQPARQPAERQPAA